MIYSHFYHCFLLNHIIKELIYAFEGSHMKFQYSIWYPILNCDYSSYVYGISESYQQEILVNLSPNLFKSKVKKPLKPLAGVGVFQGSSTGNPDPYPLYPYPLPLGVIPTLSVCGLLQSWSS
jgi:hypothetical protein